MVSDSQGGFYRMLMPDHTLRNFDSIGLGIWYFLSTNRRVLCAAVSDSHEKSNEEEITDG